MPNAQINVTDTIARRLTYTHVGQAELQSLTLNPLNYNQIRVETHFSGISRGTERLVYNGLVPKAEWATMSCPNQVGNFSFPITYGYACVGKVIETGSAVSMVKSGQFVFSLHPHQDTFIIDETWANSVPEGLPHDRAVLSANMETALNAIWDADFDQAARVAVIGGGVVGQLTAFLASKTSNKPVTLIDIDKSKAKIAGHLGIGFSTPSDLNADKERFDVIFHTSASGAGLQTAIDHAAFEAKIIEMSWYGSKTIDLSLGGRFHSQRLSIISSQVGSVSPNMHATTSHGERLQMAMEFLKDDRLDILLNPRVRFDDLPEQLSHIFDPAMDALCPLVTYV